MNKKTTLVSLRSSLLFSNQITRNFFTRFISRFKIHSNKIDLKKGLLQYSSSSRKKRQRPNTIQILWIVKNQEHRNIATLSLQLRSYKKHQIIELKIWL